MSVTTLAAGDIAIIGYNTEDTGNPQRDALTFVLLTAITSGAQIFFSDRTWNGTTFAAAGGNDSTYTYTAGSALPAGTVITITQAQLTGAGMDLSDAGETIYAYQGAVNAPTTFLYAVDVADENTTFNGSLANTGLSVAAGTAAAIGSDNAIFATRGYDIQLADLRAQISSPTHWVQNTNSPQLTPNANDNLFTAPDKQIWVASAGGGDAITTINLDGTIGSGNLGYQLAMAFQNDLQLFHPSDITLDTVHDKFFFIDSDIAGHNRVIQGSISQVLNNPGGAFTPIVLYTNALADPSGSMRTLSVDTVNQKIYFDIGTTFNRINYTTAGQTPTMLADLSVQDSASGSHYITQATIDYTHGEVYLGSSHVTTFFGQDIVDENYIYKATGLTGSNSSLTFSQLAFNPDDNDAGPPNNPNLGGANQPTVGPEAWPVERGTIRGVDVDPVNHDLYIVTGTVILDTSALQDGSQMTTYYGGVWKYDLDSNPTGNVTNVFQQDGTNGPVGLLYYIEVDPSTGKYYVTDETGTNALVDDSGIWVGNLSGGTPTLVTTVGSINGIGPQGLEIQDAPDLSGTNLNPTITETAGNPSPAPTAVQPASSFSGSDVDSGSAANDQLAGAQVRISGNFLSGGAHQDLLTIGGATSGSTGPGNVISFTYSSTTGVMTLTGITTFANYNAALALVRFNATGDNPTNYGAAGTRTISYATFDGLLYSDEVNATVTVVGVNDAPVNTVGVTASATEDVAAAAITGVSVFDVDANPATQNVKATLSVSHGTITVLTNVVGGIVGGNITAGANGSATITITATQDKINATLAAVNGLTYTATGNYNGSDALVVTTNDQGFNGTDAGLSGDGTSEQDSDSKAISIAGVNDAPVVTGGVTQAATAINEDTPSAVGDTVSSLFTAHFDDSIDEQFVAVTNTTGTHANTLAGIAITTNNSGANGQWQWSSDGGANWTNVGAASTASAVLVSASSAIRFNPAQDFNGTAPTLVAHLVDDSGGTITSGNTANLTSITASSVYSTGTVTLTENVVAVNDPPVNTVGGTTTLLEDAVAAAVNGMSIADVDANAASDNMVVTLSVAHGTISLLTNVVGGIASGDISAGANGSSTITITSTINKINATLGAVNGLTYTPTGNYNGADALTIVTNDQGATGLDPGLTGNGTSEQDSDTKTISITAVNDAPQGTDNAKTILEDNTYTFSGADFGFSDPTDGGANTLLAVKITTAPGTGSLLWDSDANVATPSVVVTNGNSIPVADLNGGRLVFSPVADGNGTPYTTFTFQVQDNGGTANSGVDLDQSANTFTMNVTAVNDAPVVDLDANNSSGATGSGYATTFTEGVGAAQGAAVSIADVLDASIIDVDNANIAGATITLTNHQAGDLLSVNGSLPGSIVASSYNASTGVLTLSGSATKAQYATALTQIQFSNTSDNPNTTDRSVTVTVTDGTDPSVAATATVHVVAVDDASVLDLDANNSSTATGADYKALYIPLGTATPIADTDVSITDVDDTNIESATITITNVKPSDLLSINGALPGSIVASSFNTGTGVLTLTGTGTLAQYQTALHQVQFSNSLGSPNTADRVITVTVNDGDLNSNTGTATITLNQPPTTPVDNNAGGNTVAEGATAGTLVGVTAFSTDPEAAGAIVYSLSDDAGGRFQINSSTGVVSVSATGATTIDYETATSHNITVVATDVLGGASSQTFAISVTDVAPTQAADTDAGTDTVSEGASNGATVGITASSTDVNGGTITYSLSNDAGGRFTINSSTGVVAVANASLLDFESATSHTIAVHAADPSGAASADKTFTINVTNVAPTSVVDSDAGANTVSEGASNGATVGVTASSSDVHGGTITYSLTNSAGGRFAINSSTGVVTVANAALLDFETATSHNITIHAQDPSGTSSADTIVAIAVTDVAPSSAVDSDAAANTVSEGASNGATVGVTASSTDVNGGTITYSLTDSAGGRFAINSSTGVVTVANAALIDFETATSHNITVRASDPSGAFSTDTIIPIAVTNVAPSSAADSDAGANTVSEGASSGDAVGVTASASDVHGGTITYSLTDSAGGRFAINSSTGVVTVANASLLNYESATSHNITIHAQDPSGASSADTVVAIAVTNVAPSSAVDSDAGTDTVSEGAGNGAVVGVTASSSDVNGGTITYSLADSAGGRFAINSSTGVVTVANAALLDFETATSHNITIHAQDPSGTSSTDTVVAIAVTDVAPVAASDANAAANTVSEGAANGDAVGITASSSDVNGGTVTFSLADNAGGRFAINSGNGVVTVADATLLDFESATSHSITVRSSDPSGAYTDQVFSIAVTDVAPVAASDSDGATNTISEGAANGDAVGITASSTDVNGGTVTFSLADNAGGRFAIGSSSGVVTVADATLLNYEGATSHSITVRSSDPSGAYTDQVFSIAVTDVAPAVPVDSNAAANSVSEAAANGSTVGVTGFGPDVHGGTVTYSLTDSANGRFAIDSGTGIVTVADASQLDYDLAQSHSITIRAADPSGLYNEQTFTIAVTNAPPAPAIDVDASANLVTENAANGTLVGITASSSDPHGGSVTFSLADSAGGRFAIDATTGVVTVANGALLDYEAAHSHAITIRATDGGGAFSDQAFTVDLADTNDVAPVINRGPDISVPENSAFVLALGAIDPDTVGIDPAAFSIVAGADKDLFTLSGNTLLFKSAPDFEAPADADGDNTYQVQVAAFDGVHTSYQLMNVHVTDVNDERPFITTPSAVTVDENQTLAAHLTTLDDDTVGHNPSAFDILGGPDAALFQVVDSNLVFAHAPDHEAPADSNGDNIYVVVVRAHDGANTYSKTIVVTVADRNDNAPQLSVPPAVDVNENTTAVLALNATDADTVGTLAWSISGGADAARFNVVDGQLVFKSAPDHEAPTDAGADNRYDVQVTVSDGVHAVSQAVQVHVLDLNDTAPVVTVNATQTVVENSKLVVALSSTDADTVNASPTVYSVSGGADAALFEIVGGNLQFKVAPDFDAPHDAGADNGYSVLVSANDGNQSGTKLLTVNVVRDVHELGLHLVGDAGNNVLEGSAFDDTFVGNGGNDTMTGHAGNDTIDGSAGIDTAVYSGNHTAYTYGSVAGHIGVTGPDGTDSLVNVERLHFADGWFAFDLDGAAGMTEKLLGALFPAVVHNPEIVGIGIGLFDSGLGYEAVAQLAIDTPAFAFLAGSHGNTDFVNYVYHNLFGTAPTEAIRSQLVSLLDNGIFTQASMAVVGAELAVNAANIGLTGMAEHGVEYTPFTV